MAGICRSQSAEHSSPPERAEKSAPAFLPEATADGTRRSRCSRLRPARAASAVRAADGQVDYFLHVLQSNWIELGFQEVA